MQNLHIAKYIVVYFNLFLATNKLNILKKMFFLENRKNQEVFDENLIRDT
jgi:hypothetical protein